MTRDHADIDAALAPLATRGAPPGFATRAIERYARAQAARARRTALAVSAASLAIVAAGAVALLAALLLHRPAWSKLLDAGVTAAAVLTHLSVHALADVLPVLAAGSVLLAVTTAAACLALAALVRSVPAGAQ